MKLTIDYALKPYRCNQKWGIYNSAYIPFGFSHHNGEDYALLNDSGAPVRERNIYYHLPGNAQVVRVGFQPNGGGNFVGIVSDDPYDFEDGNYYVLVDFLHCKQVLVKEGDQIKRGQLIAIANNTGFSTGPHCHIQYRRERFILAPANLPESYRVRGDQQMIDVDRNDMNNSFDPAPFYTGNYAQDYVELPLPPPPQTDEEIVIQAQLSFIEVLKSYIDYLIRLLKGQK